MYLIEVRKVLCYNRHCFKMFICRQPHKKKIAVLEVDEANVKMVTKLLHPSVFVLTNIFRDQMDRYGEIYTTYQNCRWN